LRSSPRLESRFNERRCEESRAWQARKRSESTGPACCNAPRECAFYRKISLLGNPTRIWLGNLEGSAAAKAPASSAAAKHLVTTLLERTGQNPDNPTNMPISVHKR